MRSPVWCLPPNPVAKRYCSPEVESTGDPSTTELSTSPLPRNGAQEQGPEPQHKPPAGAFTCHGRFAERSYKETGEDGDRARSPPTRKLPTRSCPLKVGETSKRKWIIETEQGRDRRSATHRDNYRRKRKEKRQEC